MKEKTQISLVVFVGLIFCAVVICYNVFFTQPVKVYEIDVSQTEVLQAESESSFEGTLNLNTATVQELAELPGISRSLAEKIAAYREKYGGFLTVKEITEVEGIGEKTYEKVKMYLYIE